MADTTQARRQPSDLSAAPRLSRGSRSGAVGACGTVLGVPLEELPDWLPAWCVDHLSGEPAGVLFRSNQVSMVFGLRLAGGRDVVVKARPDDGRAGSCVAAQARLAERRFPFRPWESVRAISNADQIGSPGSHQYGVCAGPSSAPEAS